MPKILRTTIWLTFFTLMVANIILFVYGVNLSDEINFYETEVKKLRQENITLEKKVFKFDSVTYAASIAAELDYTASNNTVYLQNPGYAYNR